jgi:hypothetical protein
MALKEFQIICSVINLTATGDIIKFRAPFSGTIKEIHLWTDTANTNGDNVFNLNKNGSDLYLGASRPKIAQSATVGSKTGLSDTVAFGDILLLQLESMATGGVNANLTMQILFDDGVSVSSSGYGVDKAPASPPTENDEFNSGALDAKWTQGTTGTAPTISHTEVDSHYLAKFSAANGGVYIGESFSPASSDFSVTAKFAARIRDNFQGVGLYVIDTANNPVGDGSGSEAFRVAAYSSSVYFHDYKNFSQLGAETNPVPKLSPIFLHIQRISGTWTAWFSLDGIAYLPISGSSTKSFTVGYIRLELFQSGATTKMRQAIDWVRRDWIFL